MIVCASPPRHNSDIQDDNDIRFVVDQANDEERQFTQAIVGMSCYLASVKNEKMEDIIASTTKQFSQEWLLNDISNDCDDTRFILAIDTKYIVHPIVTALFVLHSMGVVGGDPLVYIGAKDMAFGDFIFSGKNTQEQIDTMLKCICHVFGKDMLPDFCNKCNAAWESERQRFGDKYGFVLSGYNFRID
jgi:hypothetical protein